MFDLVVSKDYKKMMQENQIELTDWEKATLFTIIQVQDISKRCGNFWR